MLAGQQALPLGFALLVGHGDGAAFHIADILDDMHAIAAQVGSGDAAHVVNAHGCLNKFRHIGGRGTAHLIAAGHVGLGGHAGVGGGTVLVDAIGGDQLVKVGAVGDLLVDFVDGVRQGIEDGGLGFVHLLLGHGFGRGGGLGGRFGGSGVGGGFSRFTGALLIGLSGLLLLFPTGLEIGIGGHQLGVHGQENVLDRAEAVGFVPGMVQIAAGAVEGGIHRHLIHIAVVGFIGGDVVFVELLVSRDQRLVQILHFLIGHRGVLHHDVGDLVEHAVALIFLTQAFKGVALILVIVDGLFARGGLFFLTAFLGQVRIEIGLIIRNSVFPVGVGLGFKIGNFLIRQLIDAKFLGLLLHQHLCKPVFQRHGAEQVHIGLLGQVVGAAILGDQTGVQAFDLVPAHFLTIDGGQHVGVVKLGDGRGGSVGRCSGILGQGGSSPQHAQAQKQGNGFPDVGHVCNVPFQNGIIKGGRSTDAPPLRANARRFDIQIIMTHRSSFRKGFEVERQNVTDYSHVFHNSGIGRGRIACASLLRSMKEG